MKTLELTKDILLDELMAAIIHLNKNREDVGLEIAFRLAELIKKEGSEFGVDLHDKIREDARVMNRCPECFKKLDLMENMNNRCNCGWHV